MDELFVSYDLALRLMTKGFKAKCFKVYDSEGYLQNECEMVALDLPYINAPVYQQVTDWFRDVHNMNVYAD